jgi:hypothetical protein
MFATTNHAHGKRGHGTHLPLPLPYGFNCFSRSLAAAIRSLWG